jgi:ADP-ribose pyrophosphatase
MNTKNELSHWKVLKSNYLFKEQWFTVRCETVELPTGKQIPSFYLLEYPDWVNVIAITRENQFVFVKQYSHGLGRVDFELCAGICEKKDGSPLITAQRELMEETGYGNGVWEEYMQISANPTTHTNMTYCFLARGVEKIQNQQLEDTEDLTVHLLSIDEVRILLENDAIKQSLMAAPLWKYMAKNK